MFVSTTDKAFELCVALFFGTKNGDGDWAEFVALMEQLNAKMSSKVQPVLMQVVEKDNPPPSAIWRKRITEFRKEVRTNPLVTFTSASPITVGVIRAFNWLSPPPFDHFITTSYDDAVEWVETKRPTVGRTLHRMLAETRARAAMMR